jgi:dUTP pyrophosphatase
MKKFNIKYKFEPKYLDKTIDPIIFGSELASGFDLMADIPHSFTLESLDRYIVPTGLYFDLKNPVFYDEEIPSRVLFGFPLPTITKRSEFTLELQIRSRSGLAAKNGIMVLNSPGTIDNDYTGEIKVILTNVSKYPFTIEKGMRVGQCIPSFVPQRINFLQFEKVTDLTKTKRGDGGLGSTGLF